MRLKHLSSGLGSAKRVVCLAPGMLAVVGMFGRVGVFDICSGTQLHLKDGHTEVDVSLCVLPDKRLVSTARHGSVRLWHDLSGTVTSMPGHESGVRAMIALPDGTLVAGSKDCTIRLWNTQTATCVRTLTGHTEGILALILLPDGRLASSALDSTIKVWDLENGECVRTLKTYSFVVQLEVLPGCKLAGSGHNVDTIYLWG